MIEGEDARRQGEGSDRLAAELPGEAEQVKVDVTGGEVTLAGTTSEARRRAENVAGSKHRKLSAHELLGGTAVHDLVSPLTTAKAHRSAAGAKGGPRRRRSAAHAAAGRPRSTPSSTAGAGRSPSR